MSAKTTAEKLLIKPNSSYWLSHAEHEALIAPLPDGAVHVEDLEQAAIALIFASNSTSLLDILNEQREDLTKPPTVWVAYPKANRTDINRDTLWPLLTEYGLRPNGQVAIDDVWSALRFRPLKEGEAPFTGGK